MGYVSEYVYKTEQTIALVVAGLFPDDHRLISIHECGDRERCAPAISMEADAMSQSTRSTHPTRMTGVIAAAVMAWSFLVWTIWQVFVGN